MNLTEYFETFKANVFPVMLEDFAKHLGISTQALIDLGVGYYPTERAWVFAERDLDGKIIGLLKRYYDGKKIMFEGSQRGLIYSDTFKEVKHGSILRSYIRVHSVHVNCPICGKPDWCLISGNPDDPDSVICPRIRSNISIGEAGYLHVRHPENISKESYKIIKEPILVVEGATDVLAAFDLGFTAVGRPSAEGKIDMLRKFLIGKEVVIVGENDSGAGIKGMELVFEKLKSLCKSVTKILPPSYIKDLRDWYKNGLTREKLLKHISDQGVKEVDPNLLIDPSPLGIANRWLCDTQVKNDILLFRHHQGSFWRFASNHYIQIELDIISQELYNWLENKWVIDVRKEKPMPYCPDKYKLEKIVHALLAQTQILNGKNETEPFVIQGCPVKIDFDKAKNVVFKNGIFNIDTGKLKQSSPFFFTSSTLPYDYNPVAECPLWERLIGEWFNNDEQCKILLSQWLGYNLVATTQHEKMMILYGRPGSGKSTVTGVISALLGQDRCVALDFNDLNYTFGLMGLVGKYSAIISEDQTTRRLDNNLILQVLKRLTGNNLISVKQKFKDPFSTLLFTRITYETNELPRFIDNAQAMKRRLLILPFNNSYEDMPDVTLKDRLREEISGIANWAIQGLKDLIRREKFIEPKISTKAFGEFQLMTSPVSAMADECCDFNDVTAMTSKDQMYDLHLVWFKENGYTPYNRIWFGRVFANTFPDIKETRPFIKNDRSYCYNGIVITQTAICKYLGGVR